MGVSSDVIDHFVIKQGISCFLNMLAVMSSKRKNVELEITTSVFEFCIFLKSFGMEKSIAFWMRKNRMETTGLNLKQNLIQVNRGLKKRHFNQHLVLV